MEGIKVGKRHSKKASKRHSIATMPMSTSLQSQMEILVLDTSPKLIRKTMSMVASHHENEEPAAPHQHCHSNSKLESPNSADHIYENSNFKIPVVESKMIPPRNDHYEVVHKDDGSTHIYDQTQVCDKTPEKVKDAKITNKSHWYHIRKQKAFSVIEKPLFSPPKSKRSMTVENSYYISIQPRASPTSTTKNVSAPISPLNLNPKSLTTDKKPPVTVQRSSIDDTYMNAIDAKAMAICDKEENLAYLKTLSLNKMLQLLDHMNLGQYKSRFNDERIDGEIIMHLDRGDLVELGVIRNLHQVRLLKLIDGSVSAKKYQSNS